MYCTSSVAFVVSWPTEGSVVSLYCYEDLFGAEYKTVQNTSTCLLSGHSTVDLNKIDNVYELES
jgi:hypothetical protein